MVPYRDEEPDQRSSQARAIYSTMDAPNLSYKIPQINANKFLRASLTYGLESKICIQYLISRQNSEIPRKVARKY